MFLLFFLHQKEPATHYSHEVNEGVIQKKGQFQAEKGILKECFIGEGGRSRIKSMTKNTVYGQPMTRHSTRDKSGGIDRSGRGQTEVAAFHGRPRQAGHGTSRRVDKGVGLSGNVRRFELEHR